MTHATKRQAKTKTTDEVKTEETATRADIHQRVTDHIVAAIEAGAGCWKMPWHNQSGIRPVNATTKKAYRRVNMIALRIAADQREYQSQE